MKLYIDEIPCGSNDRLAAIGILRVTSFTYNPDSQSIIFTISHVSLEHVFFCHLSHNTAYWSHAGEAEAFIMVCFGGNRLYMYYQGFIRGMCGSFGIFPPTTQ